MRRRLVHLLQTDYFHIRCLIVTGIYPFFHLPVHPADYLTYGLIIRILRTKRAGKVFKLVTGQDGSAIAERLFVEGIVRVSRLEFGGGIEAVTENNVIAAAPLGLIVFPEEVQVPLRQPEALAVARQVIRHCFLGGEWGDQFQAGRAEPGIATVEQPDFLFF